MKDNKGKNNNNWRGGKRMVANYPCPKCGKARLAEGRNGKRVCVECHRNRPVKFNRKEWYKELRTRLKSFAIEYLGGKCIDCGNANLPHCCYHFHHVEPHTKEANVGALFAVNNEEKIKKELDKCVLLCSNCHAIRHWAGNNRASLSYS